jgi:hypothetical protein
VNSTIGWYYAHGHWKEKLDICPIPLFGLKKIKTPEKITLKINNKVRNI